MRDVEDSDEHSKFHVLALSTARWSASLVSPLPSKAPAPDTSAITDLSTGRRIMSPCVQCELPPCPPETPATTHADCFVQCVLPVHPAFLKTDRATQCDPPCLRPTPVDPSCADYRKFFTKQRPAIVVLTSELESFRNKERKSKGNSDRVMDKEGWVVIRANGV
ncbi:hypothetical protein J6590_078694 [Homalodisca vitripennis]|nr:hypothetical protein J6590_078694 [Homalodisca vitripennis]